MENCENCEEDHDGEYGSGRFCSSKYARGFSTKAKRKEINKKVSNTIKEKLKNGIKVGFSLPNKPILEKNCKCCKKDYTTIYESSLYCCISCSLSDVIDKECKICNLNKKITRAGTICIDCKEPYRLYKEQCSFKFNVYDYPDLFDLSLIEKYGWYRPSNSKDPNLNGISRDHIFSVAEGFRLNIPSNVISHITNCNLMRHNENSKKNTKCDITIEELLEKIKIRSSV